MASYRRMRGRFFTLRDMARMFEEAPAAIEATNPEILNAIGEGVQARAASYLGVPQPPAHGGFPAWAPLALSTLERKGENTPGRETGELAASIDFELLSDREVEIGTSILGADGQPYGKYFEEGRAGQPPRPFLHPAAIEIVEEMLPFIGEAIVDSIGSGFTSRSFGGLSDEEYEG